MFVLIFENLYLMRWEESKTYLLSWADGAQLIFSHGMAVASINWSSLQSRCKSWIVQCNEVPLVSCLNQIMLFTSLLRNSDIKLVACRHNSFAYSNISVIACAINLNNGLVQDQSMRISFYTLMSCIDCHRETWLMFVLVLNENLCWCTRTCTKLI